MPDDLELHRFRGLVRAFRLACRARHDTDPEIMYTQAALLDAITELMERAETEREALISALHAGQVRIEEKE